MHLSSFPAPAPGSQSAPPDVAGLSLAQIRGLEAQASRDKQQRDWETRMVATLPQRWRLALLRRHANEKTQDLFTANQNLLKTVSRIRSHFDGCALEPGFTYDDLGQRAEQFAKRCERLVLRWKQPSQIRSEIESFCKTNGVQPPNHTKDAQVIARAVSADWWRRTLGSVHARHLETCAIELGFVHKHAGLYVSDEAFARRSRQLKRSAAILAGTDAISEDGEIVSMEEIAKRSLANKAIRRAELMTRARGIEEVSRQHGFAAAFIVVTCPSRMHARGSKSGQANPNFDGTTPREAQDYLCSLWQCIRSAAQRLSLTYFGLRTVEPHHDGTPHWNLLIFATPNDLSKLIALVREYALRDNGDEAGAQRRRIRVEHIDPAKGSAVGYIAKYISKNLDAHGIDADHEAAPGAVPSETAARAEAWAALWGIRQFQDFGCPPVGVWRELRRVPADEIQQAPECIRRAWQAVQRDGEKRADYGSYFEAQGKPGCTRKDWSTQLHKENDERTGRYGEPIGPRPAGVAACGHVCRSARKRWTLQRRARASSPWTRVNNCTHPLPANEPGAGLDPQNQPSGVPDFIPASWPEGAPPFISSPGLAEYPPNRPGRQV
ncbi:MAG: replication endonuclease [Zoogloea sp.]|nr:MAG: replication endonuclease [Zoogloea sp.]